MCVDTQPRHREVGPSIILSPRIVRLYAGPELLPCWALERSSDCQPVRIGALPRQDFWLLRFIIQLSNHVLVTSVAPGEKACLFADDARCSPAPGLRVPVRTASPCPEVEVRLR